LATSTTRLALTKPDTTDLVDISVLNTNFNKIDSAAGAFVCTSTTRPATPYSGQIIYETDTDQSFVWDSATSSWNTMAPGATVCTSSSRPASPVTGQTIYETDTRLTFVYASGAWAPVVNERAVIPFSERTNYLINGGFDIWQRGTSSTTAGVYIADRWLHSWAAGTATVSRSTDVPATTFQYSLSLASTNGTNPFISQRIEAANAVQLVGQTVTFSIWAKSTVGTAALNWSTFFPTTTADTFSATTADQSGVFNATMTVGTWTRYSATFTVAAGAVRGYGVQVFRSVATTSTTTLYAGADFEIGAFVGPFSRNSRSIQGELAACQRYYYQIGPFSGTRTLYAGQVFGTTLAAVYIPYKVTMRAEPVSNFSAGAGFTGSTAAGGPTAATTSVVLASTSVESGQINLNWSSAQAITAGNATILSFLSSPAAFLGFNAEL
jgi:hypothetical protein